MTGFLIPIRTFTRHALAAVRYAVEFGKRNNARLYFLFVDDPEAGPPESRSLSDSDPEVPGSVRRKIEDLIDAGKTMGNVRTEVHFRSGDFIQEVRQFVRDHSITGIVLSLPDEHEDTFEQTRKDIQLLLKMTHCRILTVKEKARRRR